MTNNQFTTLQIDWNGIVNAISTMMVMAFMVGMFGLMGKQFLPEHHSSSPWKAEARYPYHVVVYGFEGQVLETDDFHIIPSYEILRGMAVGVAKRMYGEEGGWGPGLKMPVDKIMVTGPEGFEAKVSRWTLWEASGPVRP